MPETPQRSEDEKSITASAVIIPHPVKPDSNPLKKGTEASVRGRSGHGKAISRSRGVSPR